MLLLSGRLPVCVCLCGCFVLCAHVSFSEFDETCNRVIMYNFTA